MRPSSRSAASLASTICRRSAWGWSSSIPVRDSVKLRRNSSSRAETSASRVRRCSMATVSGNDMRAALSSQIWTMVPARAGLESPDATAAPKGPRPWAVSNVHRTLTASSCHDTIRMSNRSAAQTSRGRGANASGRLCSGANTRAVTAIRDDGLRQQLDAVARRAAGHARESHRHDHQRRRGVGGEDGPPALDERTVVERHHGQRGAGGDHEAARQGGDGQAHEVVEGGEPRRPLGAVLQDQARDHGLAGVGDAEEHGDREVPTSGQVGGGAGDDDADGERPATTRGAPWPGARPTARPPATTTRRPRGQGRS